MPIVYDKMSHSVLGMVFAAVQDGELVRVSFSLPEDVFQTGLEAMFRAPAVHQPGAAHDALAQIYEYLQGERTAFDLPLNFRHLTEFRQRVLQATMEIPYGQRTTYGDLARKVGSPRGARAVGGAMAHNPLPLVIPCHRVLAADGSLHGYSGGHGLETKAWLLELEARTLARNGENWL